MAKITVAGNTVTCRNIPGDATKNTDTGCSSTSTSIRIRISVASAVDTLATFSSKSIVIAGGQAKWCKSKGRNFMSYSLKADNMFYYKDLYCRISFGKEKVADKPIFTRIYNTSDDTATGNWL